MTAPFLRGLTEVALTSDDPERTVRFYADIVGLPLEPVQADTGPAWSCTVGGLRLSVQSSHDFGAWPAHPESNTTHLSFGIHEVDGFLTHLKRHGLTPVGRIMRGLGASRVVQVRDPDGRLVQFGTPVE